MRILVASDLSDRSAIAVDRAAQLARSLGGSVTLLHVLRPADERRLPQSLGDDILRAERSAAKTALRDLAGRHAEVDDWQLGEGKAFVEVIRRARDAGAGLIVVGAHGAHFLRDLLVGTTAERVVRKTDRPVLVAKRPAQAPYRRVVVAVDFSEQSRQAVALALSLAPEAEITLLHVYDDWFVVPMRRAGATQADIDSACRQMEEALWPELEQSVAGIPGAERAWRRIVPGYPGSGVVEQAGRLDADLVALGARGHGSVYYALLGSTAEHVMREAYCDVLTVRQGPPDLQLP